MKNIEVAGKTLDSLQVMRNGSLRPVIGKVMTTNGLKDFYRPINFQTDFATTENMIPQNADALTSEPVSASSTVLPVQSSTGFSVGHVITITDGNRSENTGILPKNLLTESKEVVVEPRNTGSASDNYNYARFYFDPLAEGEKYTFSTDVVFTDGSDTVISVLPRKSDGGGSQSFDVPIIDGKVELTFTASTDEGALYVYAGNSGETRGNGVIFSNMKLEKNNTRTQWTPAPEDIYGSQPALTVSPLKNFYLKNALVTRSSASHGSFAVLQRNDVHGARLYFDGSDHVEAPVDSPLNQSVTYECRFKVTLFNNWAAVVSNLDHSAPSSGFNIIPYPNYIRICYGNGNTGYIYESIPCTIETEKWYHVATTYDGTHFRVYLNKERIGEFSATFAQNYNSFIIGRWANSYSEYLFDGMISDVRIWNKSLSQDEIVVGVDRSNLLSEWRLSDGEGYTAKDTVGSNDGTIHGATWTK